MHWLSQRPIVQLLRSTILCAWFSPKGQPSPNHQEQKSGYRPLNVVSSWQRQQPSDSRLCCYSSSASVSISVDSSCLPATPKYLLAWFLAKEVLPYPNNLARDIHKAPAKSAITFTVHCVAYPFCPVPAHHAPQRDVPASKNLL